MGSLRHNADRHRARWLLDGADAGMRAWARRTNAERGGYQGRTVGESKGWAERMFAMWGISSEYVTARSALAEELQRLGFGVG